MKLKERVSKVIDPTPKFATQKEHDDYHRPRAVAALSPEDRAEYENQERMNKGGDAYLALKKAVPEWQAPERPGRTKAKLLPEPKYAYQSDRTSTPLKDRVKRVRSSQVATLE